MRRTILFLIIFIPFVFYSHVNANDLKEKCMYFSLSGSTLHTTCTETGLEKISSYDQIEQIKFDLKPYIYWYINGKVFEFPFSLALLKQTRSQDIEKNSFKVDFDHCSVSTYAQLYCYQYYGEHKNKKGSASLDLEEYLTYKNGKLIFTDKVWTPSTSW
jgi:hypothetical protein